MKHVDPQEWTDACRRITGKSPDEWDAVWRHRRVTDFRARKLRSSTLYTTNERNEAIRRYGLHESDFECTANEHGYPTLPAHEVERTPFERIDPRTAKVYRYRLRQECLKRIAREAR